MSQNWGGNGGGWGPPGGGAPPGGGGYGPPAGGGAPPGGGGYGPPAGGSAPPGGGYGQPPGGGGYGPPGGAPPGGGYGQPPGGGGYGPPPGAPPGGGGYAPPPPPGAPPGGGYGQPPAGGGYGPPPGGGWPPDQGGGFAPPPPGYPPGYTPSTTGGIVAWEDSSRGFFGRWWGTTKAVLFETRSFYAGAARSEDPWPAVTYSSLSAALGGLGIGITVALMYLVFGSLGAMAGMSGSRGHGSGAGTAGAMAIMGAMGVAAIFIYPMIGAFSGFIGPWITGGIYHLTLMLFKGANKPYTSTVRVAGYGHAYYLWTMVPLLGYALGWLPAMIFAIITAVVGLDETHKCGTGKAVGAVFLIPGILTVCCCAGYATLIASILGSTR